MTAATQQGDINNHEQASRLIATGRDLRGQVAELEKRAGIDRFVRQRSLQAQATIDSVMETVEKFGEPMNKFEFGQLRKELEHAAPVG